MTGPRVNDGEGNDAGENGHNNEDHSDDDVEDEPCMLGVYADD